MSLYLPALMYHHVGAKPRPGDKAGLFVQPAEFRHHLVFLTSEGYRPVGPDMLWRAFSGESVLMPERPVLLTFDDTRGPEFREALEILAEFEAPAIGYFIAGNAGDLPAAADLAAYRRLGFVIGSHTLSHPWLPDLSEERLRAELVESRQRLEDLAGAPVLHFAYPKGGYNRREVEAVRAAGYRTAMSIRRGNRHGPDELLRLRRIPVRPTTTLAYLRRCLGAVWHWEHAIREMLGLEHKNERH